MIRSRRRPTTRFLLTVVPVFALVCLVGMVSSRWPYLTAQEPDAPNQPFPPLGSDAENEKPIEEIQPPKSPFGPPPGAIRLSPKESVWFDVKRKALFIDGRVAVREGPPLEMFACPAHTKEHESVVAVYATPRIVHAGLLSIGAKAGHTVQFDPYVPATGTKIDIIVQWKDADGRSHKMPAQQWVRSIATQKALSHPWVFAGSGFWVDEESGQRGYKADSGDFICVSNFDTATLDLPIPSTAAKDGLLFEAFTEHIPPKGTPVRLILLPRLHED